MKFFALDISTNSGWCYFEDQLLKDHGTINIPTSMELPQRISYFSAQLTLLLERYKPEWVFIEDLILGISGVSVLSYLARLNGVAIYICSKYVNNNLKLYVPTFWKSHSIPGLDSMAKKWEIQLAVIKEFKLNFNISEEQIAELINRKKELEDLIVTNNGIIESHKQEIVLLTSSINSKRKPLSEDALKVSKDRVVELKKIIELKKKTKKNIEKDIDKRMSKVSNELAAKSGLGSDAADSVAICYCGIKELTRISEQNKKV